MLPGPLAEDPPDIGRARTVAAVLEDVDPVRAGDQIAEGQRAQEIAHHGGREQRRQVRTKQIETRHGGALELDELGQFDGRIALDLGPRALSLGSVSTRTTM